MKSAASFNLLRGLACAALAWAGPFLFSLDSKAAWTSAQEMAKATKTVYPGEISYLSVEYGKKGEVLSREETVSRMSYGPDGDMETDIIRATKDGKDVTAEKRAEYAKTAKKSKEKGKGTSDGASSEFSIPEPFDPPSGAKLTLGEAVSAKDGDKEVWDFPFEYDAKGIFSYKGTMRLDARTGRPISMEYGLKKAIIGVKSARFQVVYAPYGDSSFVAERLDIGFDAQILLVRKIMDMRIALSAYEDRGRIYEN